MGYGLCTPMAKQVFKLDLNPFRVSNIGRKVCIAALQDKKYYEDLTKTYIQVKKDFISKMNKIKGVKAFNSAANFIMIRFEGIDVQGLKDYIQSKGILVRLWTEGSRLSMRITVGTQQMMDELLSIIKEYIEK